MVHSDRPSAGSGVWVAKTGADDGSGKEKKKKEGMVHHFLRSMYEMMIANADTSSPLLLRSKPICIQVFVALAIFGSFFFAFIYTAYDLYSNCSESNGCIKCALSVADSPGSTCTKLAQPDITIQGSCASFTMDNNYDEIIRIMEFSKTFVAGLESVPQEFKQSYANHSEIIGAMRKNSEGQMIDPDPEKVKAILKKNFYGMSLLYMQSNMINSLSKKNLVHAGIKLMYSFLSIASILYTADGPVAHTLGFNATIEQVEAPDQTYEPFRGLQMISIPQFQAFMLHMPIPGFDQETHCTNTNAVMREEIARMQSQSSDPATAMSGDMSSMAAQMKEAFKKLTNTFELGGAKTTDVILGSADFTAGVEDFNLQGLGKLPVGVPGKYVEDMCVVDPSADHCSVEDLVGSVEDVGGGISGGSGGGGSGGGVTQQDCIDMCTMMGGAGATAQGCQTCNDGACNACQAPSKKKTMLEDKSSGTMLVDKSSVTGTCSYEFEMPSVAQVADSDFRSEFQRFSLEFMFKEPDRQDDDGNTVTSSYKHCPTSVHNAPSTLESTVYYCCTEMTDVEKLSTVNAFAGFVMLAISLATAVVFLPITSKDDVKKTLAAMVKASDDAETAEDAFNNSL